MMHVTCVAQGARVCVHLLPASGPIQPPSSRQSLNPTPRVSLVLFIPIVSPRLGPLHLLSGLCDDRPNGLTGLRLSHCPSHPTRTPDWASYRRDPLVTLLSKILQLLPSDSGLSFSVQSSDIHSPPGSGLNRPLLPYLLSGFYTHRCPATTNQLLPTSYAGISHPYLCLCSCFLEFGPSLPKFSCPTLPFFQCLARMLLNT